MAVKRQSLEGICKNILSLNKTWGRRQSAASHLGFQVVLELRDDPQCRRLQVNHAAL